MLSNNFLLSVKHDKDLIRHRTTNIAETLSFDDLPLLINLRKEGYSIALQVTYKQRPIQNKLWYVYIQRRKDGKWENKTIGRIKREFLHYFYPEHNITAKEKTKSPFLSLNKFLDDLIRSEVKTH